MEFKKEDVAAFEIGSQFRPVPFWSWNDKLEAKELVRQVNLMHEAGLGGFFMHARGGLQTPYMGKEWMDAVCVCVREAVKLGMNAYLYDENGWPSGFGDGVVNGLGEDYQLKMIKFKKSAELTAEERTHVISFYDTIYRQSDAEVEDGYAAFVEFNRFYVDNMDPKVTGMFIEKIYERYYRELPEDVRAGLAGIFTDEPQLQRAGTPWSGIIIDEYRKEYGEELVPLLPQLFREMGECKATRIRYYRLCSQLFRRNFIEKIGNWCRAHNWTLTGHHVLEERYDRQVYSSGSIMPQYNGYCIPGNDHLGRYSSYIVGDIQVVSVAAQMGKPQTLTETFGCSGWNFNMHGMKWLYQQQLVHGMTLLCQHLEGYTLRGLRKRDYPPSIFFQHPMWKNVKILNDRFSRVGRMLSCGNIECDTLIVHGESTAWAGFCNWTFSQMTTAANNVFTRISEHLDREGFPFHYGDEILMEEFASVSGKSFNVGRMSYKIVVIPLIENISGRVLELLKKFAAAGGIILNQASNHSVEIMVDGRCMSRSDAEFMETLPTFCDEADLVDALQKCRVPQLKCQVRSGLQGQVRGTWRYFPERQERWYFIADFDSLPEKDGHDPIGACQFNQAPGAEKDVPVEFTLPYDACRVEIIDQENGQVIRTPDCLRLDDGIHFFATLPASGSLLLRTVVPADEQPLELCGNWSVVDNRNVLTIDTAVYKTSEMADFSEPLNVLSIFNRLLCGPDTDLAVKYTFSCAAGMDFAKAGLKVALEPVPGGKYYLNGNLMTMKKQGEFIDTSIHLFTLPPEFLKAGENVLEVRSLFAQSKEVRDSLERSKYFESERNKLVYDSELEAIYIIGDFRCACGGKKSEVYGKGAFIDPPFLLEQKDEKISSADIIGQGFWFFSGTMILERSVELTPEQAAGFRRLSLSPFRSNAVTVTINGNTLPMIFAAPYELDVEGLLKPGDNTIRLQLDVAPRNTLGPLHTASIEPMGVGPGSFLMELNLFGVEPTAITPSYGVMEFGIRSITLKP